MAAVNALIDALGKQLGCRLQLENGVCALFDNDREVVIVEIPSAGDVAILHCKLAIRSDAGLNERILRLNFNAGAMSGCWLALDEQSALRLCAQLPLAALDEMTFVHWVQGFVLQAREIPSLLRVQTSSALRPTAARGVV